jgi:hypothetical protein
VSSEAQWPVYSLKLKGRSIVAEQTLEIRFDRATGMLFKAEQFMYLKLIDPAGMDAEGIPNFESHSRY